MERVNKLLSHLSDEQKECPLTPKEARSVVRDGPLPPTPAKYHLKNNSGNTSNFRYTLDGVADSVFTHAQRQFYEDNGFIVIRKLFDAKEVQFFRDRFNLLVSNPEKRHPRMVVVRDIATDKIHHDDRKSAGVVTKLQMWSRDKGLWQYAENKKVQRYVSAFCGDNIRGMHFMMINKPPDAGHLSSRHPYHQDQWYFPYGPSDHIVCSWTALEKVDRRNGCLSVVPGTHSKFPGGVLLPHAAPTPWQGPYNKAYHGLQLSPDMDLTMNEVLRSRVHLPMEAGDTVLFHPLLFHASGANLTDRMRLSVSIHFASSTLCKYENFKENGQHLIAKEIGQMAKMINKRTQGKSGTDVANEKADKNLDNFPIHLIWGMKSRQATGVDGNLSLEAAMKIKT